METSYLWCQKYSKNVTHLHTGLKKTHFRNYRRIYTQIWRKLELNLLSVSKFHTFITLILKHGRGKRTKLSKLIGDNQRRPRNVGVSSIQGVHKGGGKNGKILFHLSNFLQLLDSISILRVDWKENMLCVILRVLGKQKGDAMTTETSHFSSRFKNSTNWWKREHAVCNTACVREAKGEAMTTEKSHFSSRFINSTNWLK